MLYQSPQSPGVLLQCEMNKDRHGLSGFTESRTRTSLLSIGIKNLSMCVR